MNGINKLEHYITLGLKGLPGANTQVYWTYPNVMKKMKHCEYRSWRSIHDTFFFVPFGWSPIS